MRASPASGCPAHRRSSEVAKPKPEGAADDSALLTAVSAWLAGEGGRGGAFDPCAEALALREGLAATGTQPFQTLAAWRALTAARNGIARIALWGGADTADLARRRLGFAASLEPLAKPEEALARARTPGAVGVLALDPRQPWWARLLAEPKLKVFAVLPELPAEGPPRALAVAEVEVAPTGADETLWVTDAPGSEAAITAALGQAGFAGHMIASAGGLKLFALAGYVQREDPRLLQAPGRLSGVIGASPSPV